MFRNIPASGIIAIVKITFRFIRWIISLRSERTRKQKRVKENMSMVFRISFSRLILCFNLKSFEDVLFNAL